VQRSRRALYVTNRRPCALLGSGMRRRASPRRRDDNTFTPFLLGARRTDRARPKRATSTHNGGCPGFVPTRRQRWFVQAHLLGLELINPAHPKLLAFEVQQIQILVWLFHGFSRYLP